MTVYRSKVTVTPLDLSPCDRPRVIESLRGVEVVDIAAGGAHSACITASGELFTWGKGRYGRLGHGDSEDQLKPKLVSEHLSTVCLTTTNEMHNKYGCMIAQRIFAHRKSLPVAVSRRP